jgi:hypothetical protein
MKRFESLTVLAILSAGMVFFAAPARAQMGSSAPIVVKKNPPKKAWLKAEVIHADARTMMVRDSRNTLIVYTFTYSPKVQDQMEKIIESGGYQSGDKVKILHELGESVALEIKGRPSKLF